MPSFNVTVVGAGYVGMPTALSLSYFGHAVTLVDTNPARIAELRSGQCPVFEPHLDEMMAIAPNLAFTTSLAEATISADFIFIAVGTPSLEDGQANMEAFDSAAHSILDLLALDQRRRPRVLVIKSTVPVGTAETMKLWAAQRGLDHVEIASNPEFLRQGSAFHDTLFPDRIVVGGTARAHGALRELYAPLIEQQFEAPVGLQRPSSMLGVAYLTTSNKSAELAKYAANAFLAMKISFTNEIANVCDVVGADIDEVAGVVGADSRIGASFLRAGLGYGGSCFPKDTRALQHIAAHSSYQFQILPAIIEVNSLQPMRLVNRMETQLNGLSGKRVAVLGLAFKPHTDDIRESPGILLAHELLSRGAQISVHDPLALFNADAELHADIQRCTTVEEVLTGADAAVLATEWESYLQLDWTHAKRMMRGSWVFDGRNSLASDQVVAAGLHYVGVGKPSVLAPGLSEMPLSN